MGSSFKMPGKASWETRKRLANRIILRREIAAREEQAKAATAAPASGVEDVSKADLLGLFRQTAKSVSSASGPKADEPILGGLPEILSKVDPAKVGTESN